MNEEMQLAWLEISEMLGGEPTREELDVFLRTWQRASQATRKALAEQPAQHPWVSLTHEEVEEVWEQVESSDFLDCVHPLARAIEAKLKEKNT